MSEITREAVIKALSQVEDPDLRKDLVSLNMIQNLNIQGNKVSFDLILTTPACPLRDQIKAACENALIHLVNKDIIPEITIGSKVTSSRKDLSVLSGVKNIIAVSSGKGGVGKSTVSVNLALALKSLGAKVGLLDADIYGPSIPTMLNLKDAKPGMHEIGGKTIMEPVEKDGLKVLSIGFLLEPKQAVVWRGPMISSAIRQMMSDCNWGDLDYLIIDLPPGTGDIHLTLAQQFPLTGAVVVTTPQEVALTDARKAISMFLMQGINIPIFGIIENMSWFVPKAHPDEQYFIFGKNGGKELADEYSLPLLGQIPLYLEIRELADQGQSFENMEAEKQEHFIKFANNLAQQVAIFNADRLTAYAK